MKISTSTKGRSNNMDFTGYDYENMFKTLVYDYACYYGIEGAINMCMSHLNMDEDTATELVNTIWND
jgi:hypothetical protein